MSNPHDRAKSVRLYLEGWHVRDIAEEVGVHRAAVYRALDAAGVPRRDDRLTLPGRWKSTGMCGRGIHSLEDPDNVRYDSRGNRRCKECERTMAIIRSVAVKPA